jgi:hypothetical protein
MSVHVQLFHSKDVAEYALGRPVVLPAPLYCCCGFSSDSGNKIAKHLGRSGCRSAYSSLRIRLRISKKTMFFAGKGVLATSLLISTIYDF